LRTAAVVGTATVVAGSVQHHQQQKYANQDQQQYAEQQAAAAPQYVEAAPAAPAEEDVSDELTKLAQLHTQGILTDEEFSAKKAQILGI
jgi:hypothetical protein